MYEDEIKKIEKYAKENYVPIIKKEAIEYIFNIFDRFLTYKIKKMLNDENKNIKIKFNILELGLAIGYSSMRFTKYILDQKEKLEKTHDIKIELEFKIYSCEIDELRFNIAEKNMINVSAKTNIDFLKYIKRYNISADELIKKLKDEKISFDIVFIDANKSGYLKYYLNMQDILNKNHILIFDNILYNGWVFGNYIKKKHRTIVKNLRKFISYLNEKNIKYIIDKEADGVLVIDNLND